MSKNKMVRVTEEELAAIKAFREQQANTVHTEPVAAPAPAPQGATEAQQALADAFVSAIERTRPKEKITIANRKPATPWSPKNGEARLKLKRRMFHHGLLLDEKLSNQEINLLNQVKPGSYCENYVRVTLRKDRGIDIDHPVRTSSQRLKLVNQYGIRSFSELLERIIDEKANPSKYRKSEDADLYDLES